MSAPQAPPAASTPPDTRAANRTTFRHLLILTAFTLFVCFPVLLHGLPDLGNDSINHAILAQHFNRQFWAGEWYPRWLPDANAGYGTPTLFFYPPVPSVASALFWHLVRSYDPAGWYLIGFSCILSVLLASFAAYFWCRAMAPPGAALFGALLYAILPYHLAVNLYTRGAVGELWAIVWPPFVLLAVERLCRGRKWAFVGLALSYGMLVLTHLPTTLCFSLIPLAAALYLSQPGERFRSFLKTGFAMGLGVGIAAIYLLPSMLDKSYVNIAGMSIGWYDYHRWWLLGIHPLLDARTRLMLLTFATVAYLAVVVWISARARPDSRVRRLLWLQAAVAALTLLMTTQVTDPLWHLIPTLHEMQFPTRFLNVFIVMVPGLSAIAWSCRPWRRSRLLWSLAGIFVLGWIASDIWAGAMAYTVWRPVPPAQARFYADLAVYQQKILRYQRLPGEFWPRDTRSEQLSELIPPLEQFIAAHPPRAVQLRSLLTGEPVGAAAVETWRPRDIFLRVDTPEPARLTLNHFYYLGWVGYAAGIDRSVSVAPTPGDGLMQMEIPAGRYTLHLQLARRPPERAGIYLSLCSILIAAALALRNLLARPAPSLPQSAALANP